MTLKMGQLFLGPRTMSKPSLKKSSPRAVAREQLSAMAAKRFAEGGEVEADEDEKGVGEVGSAQELLAQLEGRGPRSDKKAAPAPKRMATRSDGASMPKGMGMEQESLGSVRELVAMAKDKGSARQQMEELARLYKLKITAAQDRSRGMAASTFGAPTLEGTTLTKNTLATKRFAEGGEVSGVPSTGFVTGRPIEFSKVKYSPYSVDFVTAKPTSLTPSGAGSSEVVDPNPQWTALTNEKKAQYYQENPRMAAATRVGQAAFGLMPGGVGLMSMVQNRVAPDFVREQQAMVGGPLFDR